MVKWKWFKPNGSWIMDVRSKNLFYVGSSYYFVYRALDLLNEGMAYKIIVLNDKEFIEDFNQKSINELKESLNDNWYMVRGYNIFLYEKWMFHCDTMDNAKEFADFLNDLTTYKMIVRRNKQFIMDINQKSINDLKKEVLE